MLEQPRDLLKQIKTAMNKALSQLPEEEQKKVDTSIYYDSRLNSDPQYIGTCLHMKEFYMYYKKTSKEGLLTGAVDLDIYPDNMMTVCTYVMHKGQILVNSSVDSIFGGSLQVLDDMLPECSLKKVISQ